LYRAIDKEGQTIDWMLSKTRKNLLSLNLVTAVCWQGYLHIWLHINKNYKNQIRGGIIFQYFLQHCKYNRITN